MGYLKTLEQAKVLLIETEDFNAGTLTASWELGESHTTHRRYVVRSYGVIIAWQDLYHLEIMPNAYSHSKTTSKHANIVRKAWGLN